MKGNDRYRKEFLAALGGTVLLAACCFIPVLVILVGAVGLAAFTPYLDYVLFPALAVLILLTVVSYRRWKKSCACSADIPDQASQGERGSIGRPPVDFQDQDPARREVGGIDGRAVRRDRDLLGGVDIGVRLREAPVRHETPLRGQHDDPVIPAVRHVEEVVRSHGDPGRNLEPPPRLGGARPQPEQTVAGPPDRGSRGVEPLELVVVCVGHQELSIGRDRHSGRIMEGAGAHPARMRRARSGLRARQVQGICRSTGGCRTGQGAA
jgi:mercuric ion transport protein